MDPERDLRLLTRAKWVGVVLPIGLIWAFELVRYFVIDPTVPADSAHLFAALVMSGGAVLFALGIFAVLDRTQRRLVDTNRDLAATHAVASGLQGDQELRAMLEAALDRVLEHTGALAGQICVSGPGDQLLKVRRPGDLGDIAGMQWAHAILDETPALAPRPDQTQRPGVDASVVDLPLAGSIATVGTMRLVFHPSGDPAISMAALADVTGDEDPPLERGAGAQDLPARRDGQGGTDGPDEAEQDEDPVPGPERTRHGVDRAPQPGGEGPRVRV